MKPIKESKQCLSSIWAMRCRHKKVISQNFPPFFGTFVRRRESSITSRGVRVGLTRRETGQHPKKTTFYRAAFEKFGRSLQQLFGGGTQYQCGVFQVAKQSFKNKARALKVAFVAASSFLLPHTFSECQASFVAPPQKKRVGIKHRLTVYYPGQDKWTSRFQSASGKTLKNGISVATDLKTYDFDDKIFIEGLGERVVHDTGTAVKERTASRGKYPIIDIFFASKHEALKFANRKRYAVVYLVENH